MGQKFGKKGTRATEVLQVPPFDCPYWGGPQWGPIFQVAKNNLSWYDLEADLRMGDHLEPGPVSGSNRSTGDLGAMPFLLLRVLRIR